MRALFFSSVLNQLRQENKAKDSQWVPAGLLSSETLGHSLSMQEGEVGFAHDAGSRTKHVTGGMEVGGPTKSLDKSIGSTIPL